MPTICSSCGRTSGKCQACIRADALPMPEAIYIVASPGDIRRGIPPTLIESRGYTAAQLRAARLEGARAAVEAMSIKIERRILSPADVLKRIIRNMKPKRGRPMWSAVHEASAHGSTVSAGLCLWAGVDPETGAAIDAAMEKTDEKR